MRFTKQILLMTRNVADIKIGSKHPLPTQETISGQSGQLFLSAEQHDVPLIRAWLISVIGVVMLGPEHF